MEHYWIIARSVTFAQRMQSALTRSGVRCRIFRAPRELVELGCAYAVEIPEGDLDLTMTVLRREALPPVQIFAEDNGRFREVAL